MIPLSPQRLAVSTNYVFTVIAILLSFVLISCNSHDDMKICALASVVSYGTDSTIYVYGDNNRLEEMLTRSENSSDEQFLLSHANEKLVKCVRTYEQSGKTNTETFLLTYGSNGQPSSMTRALGSDPVIETVNYVYDDKDRLVRKETESSGTGTLKRRTRYEYNDDNNVTKIYYIQGPDQDEIIGAENLSFDNHQVYYAGSSDLVVLLTYILDGDPGANNVVSVKWYAEPGYTFPEPATYNVTYTYDEKGYATSLSFYNPFFPTELVSAQLNYTCR